MTSPGTSLVRDADGLNSAVWPVPGGVRAPPAAGKAGEARHLSGDSGAGREVGYLDPFAVTVAHVALGETETAAHWARRTYDDRSPGGAIPPTQDLPHIVNLKGRNVGFWHSPAKTTRLHQTKPRQGLR